MCVFVNRSKIVLFEKAHASTPRPIPQHPTARPLDHQEESLFNVVHPFCVTFPFSPPLTKTQAKNVWMCFLLAEHPSKHLRIMRVSNIWSVITNLPQSVVSWWLFMAGRRNSMVHMATAWCEEIWPNWVRNGHWKQEYPSWDHDNFYCMMLFCLFMFFCLRGHGEVIFWYIDYYSPCGILWVFCWNSDLFPLRYWKIVLFIGPCAGGCGVWHLSLSMPISLGPTVGSFPKQGNKGAKTLNTTPKI